MAEVKMPESLEERFPGNSDKQKREANRMERHDDIVKNAEPVVEKGTAKHRKKGLGEKVKESFIGDEDGKGVVEYIVYDVLIPAAKDMIFEAITGGLSMRLFGESRGYSRVSKASGYTSYNKINARPARSSQQVRSRGTEVIRTSEPIHRDYSDDVIFDERPEAYEVLDKLCSVIEACGFATVADLHQFSGMPIEYTDNSRGWTNLSKARVIRLNRGENAGGYLLSLPNSEPIDELPPF